MNDKKNLDRLFQERFKDFEMEPDEQVWKNIESALKEKEKKRRVIPFWYRLSGVAAALILGAFILNSIFDFNGAIPENSIVTEENNTKSPDRPDRIVNGELPAGAIEKERSQERSRETEKNKPKQETITRTDNDAIASENKSGKSGQDKVSEKLSSPKNAVATQLKKKAKKTVGKGTIAIPENAVAQQNNTSSNKGIPANGAIGAVTRQNITSSGKDTRTNASGQQNNGLPNKAIPADAIAQQTNASSGKGIITGEGNKAQPAGNDGENKVADLGQAASGKTKPSGNTVRNSSIANQDEQKKNTLHSTEAPFTTKPTTDVAATPENKKLDSTAIATVVPNALEELLNEKEKNSIAETKLNRWQVTPNVAPIYFGSTTNGSPIDPQFSNNDKTYEKNLSYGVAFNYAVSKKFNVRTGINKLTLGYQTNDVSFSAGLASKSFANLSAPANAAIIQVVNSDAGLLPFETSLQGIKTGSILQTMGYIEVPMEMSYKLVDRKFGINLIGGVSTLFLDENEVTVASTDLNTSLGSANNLNDVHFSSNIGVGFKYSFWKTFEFNFEPTLKYQINTFSKNAGDFKPYFLGLYTGVSFKF